MSRSSRNRSRGIFSRWIEDDSPRWCAGCEQRLPVEAFSVDRSKPSGRKSRIAVREHEVAGREDEHVRSPESIGLRGAVRAPPHVRLAYEAIIDPALVTL